MTQVIEMNRDFRVETASILCLVLGACVGCGGLQTSQGPHASQGPPPCTATTTLLPDGEVLQHTEYSYDNGHLVTTETRSGQTSELMERVETRYDPRGRIAGQITTAMGDAGTLVGTESFYTYDDDGNLVSVDWQLGDMSVRREEYLYDDDDLLVEEVHYLTESEFVVERVIHYSYTESGQTASVLTDEWNDGSVEVVTRHTYTEAGQPLGTEVGVGYEVNIRTRYGYDDEGRLLSEEDDVGADGSVDHVKRYLYDAEGVLVRTERDVGNDGTIERRVEYVYDEEGRLFSESVLQNPDHGEPSSTSNGGTLTEYDYSCWDRERTPARSD